MAEEQTMNDDRTWREGFMHGCSQMGAAVLLALLVMLCAAFVVVAALAWLVWREWWWSAFLLLSGTLWTEDLCRAYVGCKTELRRQWDERVWRR